MRNRIGRTAEFTIEVLTDGEKVSLANRDLYLELYDENRKTRYEIEDYEIDGNKLSFKLEGTMQQESLHLGAWSLSLWENKGKASQNVCDWIKVLVLVPDTPSEG